MEKISELPQAELREFLDGLDGSDAYFKWLCGDAVEHLTQERFVKQLQLLGYQGDALQDFFNIDADCDGAISLEDIQLYLKAPSPRTPGRTADVSSEGRGDQADYSHLKQPSDGGLVASVRTQLEALQLELRRAYAERQEQHSKMVSLMRSQVAEAVRHEVDLAVKKIEASVSAEASERTNATEPAAGHDVVYLGLIPSKIEQLDERLCTVEDQCRAILRGFSAAAETERVEEQCRAILQGFSNVVKFNPSRESIQAPASSSSADMDSTAGLLSGMRSQAGQLRPSSPASSPPAASAVPEDRGTPSIAEAFGTESKRITETLLRSPQAVPVERSLYIHSPRHTLPSSSSVQASDMGLAKSLLCRSAGVMRPAAPVATGFRQQASEAALGRRMTPELPVQAGATNFVNGASAGSPRMTIGGSGGSFRTSIGGASVKATAAREAAAALRPARAAGASQGEQRPGIVRMYSAPDREYMGNVGGVVRMVSVPSDREATVGGGSISLPHPAQVASPRFNVSGVDTDPAIIGRV